ncbi:MAG: hypothetical protein IT208_10615 [Chthonomonadales bacterium]|nr:hypothetical protein [Chthonomonadales bacterium]
MPRAGVIGMLGLAAALAGPAAAQSSGPRSSRPGFVLAETAPARGIRPARYDLEAYGADIGEVLTAILRKAGREFSIDQDVRGPVSLIARDATLERILERVGQAARPPLRVTRDGFVRVSLASLGRLPATDTADQPPGGPHPALQGPLRMPGGYPQAPLLQQMALARPVTLHIPDDRAVPLATAMREISAQTRVPIRLDRRIPPDITFAASFSQAPLSLVMDTISRTGAMKWMLQPDGSLLLSPTDWVRLALGRSVVAGFPGQPCPKCGRAMMPTWSYCPYDGRSLSQRKGPSSQPPSRP